MNLHQWTFADDLPAPDGAGAASSSGAGGWSNTGDGGGGAEGDCHQQSTEPAAVTPGADTPDRPPAAAVGEQLV